MILVTGATGHLGSATINFLLKKVPANQISALVRSEAKAAAFKEKGITTHIGDYTDYDSMVKAFAGTDKLFLISSSDLEGDRAAQHINAIKAAKAAGVKHIVYTGIDLKDPDHTVIAAVEDAHKKTAAYLKNSGLRYTVLDNNLYADVLPQFLGEKVQVKCLLPRGWIWPRLRQIYWRVMHTRKTCILLLLMRFILLMMLPKFCLNYQAKKCLTSTQPKKISSHR